MHLSWLGPTQAGGKRLTGLLDDALCVAILLPLRYSRTRWPTVQPTTPRPIACSRVIGTWGKTASWVAQTTAASDSANPSTPTTVPYYIVVFHISRSLPRALYLHPEGLDEQPIRCQLPTRLSTKLPTLLGQAGGVGLEHRRLRRHPTPS